MGAATVVGLLVRRRVFRLRDMAVLPGAADVAPYVAATGGLALNNLSALAPTLVATTLATSLGGQHLGAHTVLRTLMGFWLQVGGWRWWCGEAVGGRLWVGQAQLCLLPLAACLRRLVPDLPYLLPPFSPPATPSHPPLPSRFSLPSTPPRTA